MRWLRVSFSIMAVASLVVAFQDRPPFRVSTRLVQINVVVRDKYGPVSNLSRGDFTLFDKGKLQNISVFSVNSINNASENATPLRRNTFSNRENGGATAASVTVVLLGRLNTFSSSAPIPDEETPTWVEDHALANAKQHVLEFVTQLDPKDRVAVYSLGESLDVLCDFTSDREELRTILKNYRAPSLTRREEVEPLAVHTPMGRLFDESVDRDRRELANIANRNRSEKTMAALLAIAGHLAGIPGRKNLVWLTANLPFSGATGAIALSRVGVAIYPVDARGLLTASPPATEEDLDSQVRRHSLVAQGHGPQPTGINTMRDLADETGGRAFVNTNDLTGAIRQAVEDATVTYTIGFYPNSDSLDGKFHKLKVEVKHEGVDIRYPSGYFASKSEPAPETQPREVLVRAVQSPLQSSLIQILARVERVAQPNSNALSIVGSIRLDNIQLSRDGNLRKGAISLYIVQQNAAGKMLAQSDNGYDLQLTNELYETYLKSGLPFRYSVQPKASVATLRVLIIDRSNAEMGSLIIPVSAIK